MFDLLEKFERSTLADKILETYKRVETDESFTTGGGSISTPVATLTDEWGGRAQIGVDDHCYVLYLLQEDGSYKHTAWIFPEAHEVLKDLPVPKYPLAEIQEGLEDKSDEDLIEKLAALEHEQWICWAKDILKTEDISKERAERWKELFATPYDELDEEMKELDREWARKALAIVEEKE